MASPREEFLAGAREIAPVLVGMLPFGLVTGVAATASGLTAAQGIALSMLSFSGIAQLIVCQLIAAGSPAIVVVGAGSIVSLRFVMYSAAVSPHLAHLDWRWRSLLAFLMTDQSFSMTTARFSAPGDRSTRHWHTLGAALTLYLAWQATVIAGIAAGSQVPERWSLDFAVVLTFIALLVPAVRTRADLAAAMAAAAVALVALGLPYRLSLVAASLAGIAAGLAIERTRRR
ncbi:MAG TPA: AzlC family ABC transporter permease [Usitatibacter sp.]|jgi:predicted branched-subunit amino acid permease|nr:AzlC family ABC transporter permease [Usitatibacter sp.]